MVDMAASRQLSHQIRLDGWLWALVARVGCEPFHANGAVLEGAGANGGRPSVLTKA